MHDHNKLMAAARANFPNMAHFGPDPKIFKPFEYKKVELVPPRCKTEADIYNYQASLPPIKIEPLMPLNNSVNTPKIDIPKPTQYLDFLKKTDY